MVNLELYRIFVTVARCGSLSKAADELYISQPAVSQAIRQLEARLGTQLFNRKHKGMELTVQGGELIYADVERALKIITDAENKLSQLNQSATGTLRIGASETIFQYILSPVIVEYNHKYPQVKIDLISDVSPKITEALKADRCDKGFLNLPIDSDDGINIIDSIMYLHDVFIAGVKFGELKDKPIGIRELKDYPLLLMEEHTVARETFERYTKDHGVTLAPAVEVDSWGFMKRLVIDGMGIGCIPREYALHKLSDGTLFELDVQPKMPVRSVGMALPKNANMPFALQAFMELLKNRNTKE